MSFELPKEQKVVLKIWATSNETIFISSFDTDMTDAGWVLLGEHEDTVPIPQKDPRPEMVAALRESIKKERAESEARVNKLEERIQQPQAIEFQP